MHVDDYQRAAARPPAAAAAAAGRKAEKLNVQQLLADPTSMQVIAWLQHSRRSVCAQLPALSSLTIPVFAQRLRVAHVESVVPWQGAAVVAYMLSSVGQ